jgi:hypothetical protein
VERATGGKTIEKRLPARDSGAVQARPTRFFTKNAPISARLSYPKLIVAVPLMIKTIEPIRPGRSSPRIFRVRPKKFPFGYKPTR